MDAINTKITVPQGNVAVKSPKAEEESGAQIQDSVEKSQENGGFFTRMKELVSSGVDKNEEAYRSSDVSVMEKYRGELIGAGVGFVGAGIFGAVIAHNSAMGDVSKIPVETVTLDWKEPAMQQKTIGQIPASYYEPANIWGWINNNNGKVDVVRDAPVLGPNGQPVLNPKNQTFTDHGKVVVRWEEHKIQDPQLKGAHETRIADNERVMVGHHTEKVQVGTDGQNRPIYENREVDDYETRTKGWNHSFSPDIDYKTVGTYQKPEVTFETGVSVGLRTFTGFLIGAATGAVGVALATTAAKRAIARMQEKKAQEAKS